MYEHVYGAHVHSYVCVCSCRLDQYIRDWLTLVATYGSALRSFQILVYTSVEGQIAFSETCRPDQKQRRLNISLPENCQEPQKLLFYPQTPLISLFQVGCYMVQKSPVLKGGYTNFTNEMRVCRILGLLLHHVKTVVDRLLWLQRKICAITV